jgi:hypothetical protein
MSQPDAVFLVSRIGVISSVYFLFFFLLKERKENRTTPLSEMGEQPKFQPEFL